MTTAELEEHMLCLSELVFRLANIVKQHSPTIEEHIDHLLDEYNRITKEIREEHSND